MATDEKSARPVQLHVIHDLGGGSAKWLRDFGRADDARTNLVLRSFTYDQAAGGGVALHAGVDHEQPLKAWVFQDKIVATAVAHPEYRRALEEIVREHRVDVLLVSSVIGHSLEVLDTGLPTVVVNHDYFPFCPAINLHFGGTCRECDDRRIEQCHRENPRLNPFVDFLPPERIAVRARFLELAQRPNVTLVVPSRTTADNLLRVEPAFAKATFVTIPHAYGEPLEKLPVPAPGPGERLRVVVLGQLSEAKGLRLLRDALPSLTRFAEIYLLGAREVGEMFRFRAGVHVVSQYEMADLPVHIANINPHVGLLASIVPETFSYALSELMMLGVPVAATRVGSFAERIRDGENGYLFEPDSASLVRMLSAIDADRAALARVRAAIAGWRPTGAAEMVAAYHRITPVAAPAQERAPSPAQRQPATAAAPDHALVVQALAMADMWKQVKSLNLQLALVNEARSRVEADKAATLKRLERSREQIDEHLASLAEKDRHIRHIANQLELRNALLEEVYASTSWRVSAPVRLAGRVARQLGVAGRIALAALRNPAAVPGRARKVAAAWREGGWLEAKKALVGLQQRELRAEAWLEYRRTFERDVRPLVVRSIGEMPSRPLVSVLVPTYNTVEDMLIQMLESVRGQLYADWELCVADDASTEPHVQRILEEYAAADRRIKLHLGRENRGVSHATNRALELATGGHVVLLDHDDILEEHALFRVAQSIVEDDPDFLYSDEALVTPDGGTVRRYAFRPAFSPEYLRSHPYIVHLAGLRTRLLRELGGFDESLRISQDYDLILRATEKARTIVHIPDVLYRWRIHGASAGSERMHQVMETSKAVLQRHLDRCNLAGTVKDGPSFNLFDVRYSLRADLKVAIIIPTRDHGELLRQCIDSIRATAGGVAYEIVVVDHQSEDPATREYLASLAPEVRILRYEGVFNFSAINNLAVAQLDEGFSHYLFCNNDIEALEPGWLERMLELGQQPSVGIVGATLYYPDRKAIQHAGVCVGLFGAAEHYGKWLRFPGDPVEPGFGELLQVNREVAAVTAACMLIRREAFGEVSGFDESIAVGFGDVDLCLRVGERGYRVVMSPNARLVHHESYTRGPSSVDPHPKDSALYRLKWKSLLEAGDPYYSPGLSLTSTQWALKLPLHCSFAITRRIVRIDAQTGRESLAFSAADGNEIT